MTDIYNRFDNEYLTDELLDGCERLKNNSNNNGNREYKEVSFGKHEVKVTKLELGESSTGKPMVKGWFKVIGQTDPDNGGIIFMNQLLDNSQKIHFFKEFLRSLDSGLEVDFISYRQFGELINDIKNSIENRKEYVLDYGKNAKGYSTYFITQVFNA